MKTPLLLTAAIFCGLLQAQPPHSDKRLVFSTFHGGGRNDDARAVAVDPEGYIYVTGETESRDLKADAVGGKPLSAATAKSYLTKYAPGGKEIVWRKLIGGSALTVAQAIALDRENNICLTGITGARDLPLVHPTQAQHAGSNIAFVMKFSPAGELLFSTYFGGRLREEGNALAVDSRNNLYVGGRSTSPDLPVRNALQPQLAGGGADAFIAKFTPDHRLEYATYFGGSSGTDNVFAMAIGPDDSLYVTGDNMSPGMATKDAWGSTPQAYSGFLAKLTPAGDSVSYFTYIGWRSGYTSVRALAVDQDGQAYVAGHTSAKGIPATPNAIQPAYAGGRRDGFLLRIDATGTAATYFTYVGGSVTGPADPDETVSAVQIDSHGHVYVTGETVSPDFPGRREVQRTHGGAHDSFLVRIDTADNQIVYATFWGGQKKDTATALALGPGENATIVGESFSDDFPVFAATQSRLGSINDAFVAQICDPWLTATSPVVNFNWTAGAQAPDAQEVTVTCGCAQPFDAEVNAGEATWLEVARSGPTVPLRLQLRLNTQGLMAGEYRTTIRVTVLEAFQRTIEIPVVLTVTD
ncbi:MAG: SBBP repeat-containing protein [Bryobacteraceae bacterium]|nr:SBBP repeat-containing protein [Bryobacteraceae bacterium]